MKRNLVAILCLMATCSQATLTFTNVDVTTLTTNTITDTAQITITNFFTNAFYVKTKTNNTQIGDSLYTAFTKINNSFGTVSNFMANNGSGSAIANNNGYGTNVSLFGNTWLNNSNLNVYATNIPTYYASGFAAGQPIGLIPNMTATNAPSGNALDYLTNSTAYKAFTTNQNYTISGTPAVAWIQYAFPVATNVGAFSYSSVGSLGNWTMVFQYSIDGTNWNTIWTGTNIGGSSAATTPIPVQSVTAQYYQWVFTNVASSFFYVDHLNVFPAMANNVISPYLPLTVSTPKGLYLASINGVAVNSNSASIYDLNVAGPVNASDMYYVGDQPIFNVLKVTGGTSTATNDNGMYVLGYGGHVFTNTANTYGILLPGAYSVGATWVGGNNSYTLVTNVNLPSTWTNIPIYFNFSMLGQYLPGYGSPTPAVSVSVPVMLGQSAVVGIQTNIVGPHGLTLLFTNGLFYGTSPY